MTLAHNRDTVPLTLHTGARYPYDTKVLFAYIVHMLAHLVIEC